MKFAPDDRDAIRHFVREGYTVYEGVFDPSLISDCRDFVLRDFERLETSAKQNDRPRDVNGWSVAIMQHFERTVLYEALIRSPTVVTVTRNYLGLDIGWFGHDGLFINVPQDKDPVLLKGQHTDVWTGTGVNTLFFAVFFTDVDEYNGLSVCPGSHLQGLMPVRNRAIDPACGVQWPTTNLADVKAGDVIVWHPLLVHSTTGHSNKNVRISMTSRLVNLQGEMTSQEKALGYQTISIGPMNEVLRLVGNDYLTPFRTLGGYVGIDRRMAAIYPNAPYKEGVDYGKYL